MCMSRPKVPAPTPIVERQAYKTAPSRSSLYGGNSEARRRTIAGVVTSAQGLLEPASTTKRVMAGGDQIINPVIGGSGPSPTAVLPAPAASSAGPTYAPQFLPPRRSKQSGAGVRPNAAFIPSMLRQRPRLA